MRKESDRHGLNQIEPGRPAPRSSLSAGAKRHLRKTLLWTLVGAALGWFVFFDSHSLLKRMTWRSEYLNVREENEKLRTDIEELDKEARDGLSDEAVEKIAREEYGMRRPGETVYPVTAPDDGEKDDLETLAESSDRATDNRLDGDE